MPRPGSTVARGYGAKHKAERAKAKRLVDSGQAWCWRQGPTCLGWLDPSLPWDLGHDDHDRSIYRGPECVPCNRGTAGRTSRTSSWRSLGLPRIRTCEVCGAQYRATTRDQRTCGRTCGWELRKRNGNAPQPQPRPVILRPTESCTECNTAFRPARANQVTCSPECASERNGRRARERYHGIENQRARWNL